jgi:hypothetical protein
MAAVMAAQLCQRAAVANRRRGVGGGGWRQPAARWRKGIKSKKGGGVIDESGGSGEKWRMKNENSGMAAVSGIAWRRNMKEKLAYGGGVMQSALARKLASVIISKMARNHRGNIGVGESGMK